MQSIISELETRRNNLSKAGDYEAAQIVAEQIEALYAEMDAKEVEAEEVAEEITARLQNVAREINNDRNRHVYLASLRVAVWLGK